MDFLHERSRNRKKIFGGLAMSNHLLQNVKDSIVNRDLASTHKPIYDDDVIECLQFGICSVHAKPQKEIPYYFHF